MSVYVPPYAVLFKTHFWDEFSERQFRRLRNRAGAAPIFVIVDETRGPVCGIRHDNVIRMTEEMSEADGYLRYPAGNVFWHNTDYQVYHFFDEYPEFNYVFICEYDCVINIDIAPIMSAMASQKLHFVGEPVRTPRSYWHWARDARPFYDDHLDIHGRLVCCAGFSQRFARILQTARRDHTRRLLAGEIVMPAPGVTVWPNNEAIVGAEIERLSLSELPLSHFGDTSCYDWSPPHLEGELQNLDRFAVVHPVLDVQRYLRVIIRLGWNLEDIFTEDSALHRVMGHCSPELAIPLLLRHFAEKKNWNAVDRLRDYAFKRLGAESRVLFNVAKGKPATQSSISQWSRSPRVADDAAGAVDGKITGTFGFHTNFEIAPWWCVDLEAIYAVRQICVYNRMDVKTRARGLEIKCSTNMLQWNEIHKHEGDDFGGSDGRPLTIGLSALVEMRFLRISLPHEECLHLDEVEIFV